MGVGTIKLTIASTGVSEPLSATTLKVHHALVQAGPSNGAQFLVGDSNVSTTRGICVPKHTADAFDQVIPLRGGELGNDLDLSEVYVIGTKNDVVEVLYFQF